MLTLMFRHLAPRSPWLLVAAGALLVTPPALTAQDMGQGEANITAQANVQITVESGPSTSAEKLSRMGAAIGPAMGDIRQCYRDVVEETPTIEGAVMLLVTLGREGAAVEVRSDDTESEELVRCTVAALEGADWAGIRPPGAAYVGLTFRNSAAEGVARTASRAAREAEVALERDAEGRLSASGGTPSGDVAFTVRGHTPRTPPEAVTAAYNTLRTTIPTFLDCRRRAARRASPEGEVQLSVQVRPRRARVRASRSTVESERAGPCLTRGLTRARYGEEAVGHRFDVTIRFTGAQLSVR